MSQNDEKTTKANEPIEENEIEEIKEETKETVATESEKAKEEAPKERVIQTRWIVDDDEPDSQKSGKKSPYIQVPVIISLCLVIVSLLAFFAYKYVFITEPEGVIWGWHSEEDGIDYFYEFKDNNEFKSYFGSFEITATYSKNKNEGAGSKLTVSDPAMAMQYIGCFYLGSEVDYSVSGLRITGNQEMTLSYPSDSRSILLKQAGKWECPLELPENFTEDTNLTGEWINVYSTNNAKQTLIFNDDGSMKLAETYTFSGGKRTEILRYCTYTVSKSTDKDKDKSKDKTKDKETGNEINITWIGKEPVVHNTKYEISQGLLYLDGSYFYRADNNPATPDQTK